MRPTKDKKPQLNPKQKSFVLNYLIDKNATQAAIRAGYSKKTAEFQGCRLLTNDKVADFLNQQLSLQEKRTLVTADEVISELKKIAFLDIRGAFNDNGSLKDIKDIPDDVARAIAGIEIDDLFEGYGGDRTRIGYTKKLKLNDKTRALELLGKHLKILTDKVEHSGSTQVVLNFNKAYAGL